MASNTTLNSGTGGDIVATKEITLDGDTAKVQMVELRHLTGSEGAYTANNVFHAEDAAHTSGDFGVQMLTRRSDTAAATSGTDGDYQPAITDANGRLHVIEPSAAAALTALQLIDNLVLAEDAAHASGDPGVQVLAVRSDTLAARAGTTGDYTPLQADAQGALYTRVVSSSGATIDPQADDAAFTAATSLVSVIAGFATSDSVDSGDAGALRMTTTRHLMIEEQGTHNIVDDAAYTAATNRVTVIGGFATTDAVDSGDAGAFAMTTARAQHVTLKTDTVGGPTIFRSIDIDESEEEIKATAGQVYWIHAVNLTADPIYLKFYNATAANVTVGTTTPVLTFPVVSQGTTDGAGFVFNVPQGIPFSTAITVAATTGVADADTGAPAANACIINIGFA